MERNVTKQKELLSFVPLQPYVMRLNGLQRDSLLRSSFVLLYLYVMCNYQGEIFTINKAEFKISAATLLNLKRIESIFGPPVA